MNRSFKRLGLALLLLSLLVLFVRMALTTLEVQSGPTQDPNKTIRKVERDLKQAAQKEADQIKRASEAEEPAPPPPAE